MLNFVKFDQDGLSNIDLNLINCVWDSHYLYLNDHKSEG